MNSRRLAPFALAMSATGVLGLPPGTTPASSLPVTGTSKVVLVAVASVLIIGGAALLALIRSRRKETSGR